MTRTLLLDTHVAIWLEDGDQRLKPSTLGLIDRCWRNGGLVVLSTVSVWEIAQLIHAGRIKLGYALEQWVRRFADRPGVELLPLSAGSAVGAYRLQGLDHRDPADRLLIATAIEQSCPLVTYDERIIRFANAHGASHGFSAIA